MDQQLKYGRSPRRRLQSRGCLAVLIAVPLLTAVPLTAFFGWQSFVDYDRNSVRDAVEGLPGVVSVDVYGFREGSSDMSYFTVVGAALTLARGPDDVIDLTAPDASDLRSGRHLHVQRLGEFRFALVHDATNSWHGSLDIGSEGTFAHLLPFQLDGADDLVRRYEEICDVLARMPPSGTMMGRDGRPYRYVISSDGSSPTLPLRPPDSTTRASADP